jgi:predicted TIM-barrel fold metal-dependent hydrolase
LERCVKELGFVAWHTHSDLNGASLEEARFRPLFQKAAELDIYIYLHPALPHIEGIDQYGFTFAGPGAGFTIGTMLTVLKLIVSGLFDEIPGIKLVLGHLGEAIPFLLDRIDNRLNFLPNKMIRNKRLPSDYFRTNIKVTTSGNMSSAAFACTKEVIGIENILFGSDYPFENLGDMTHFVNTLPLTEQERGKLFYQNAQLLLQR